jgi:ATP-dependent phosphofructokinase / diphosphate-dependent phosphofructokinase
MSGPLSAPSKKATNLKRVAILFAGGPAPAANAVISTAAAAFQRNDIKVLGILYGYSNLADFSPEKPLEEEVHYVELKSNLLKRSRNSQGIMIGTARTNPGKNISHPSHLDDPKLAAPLRRVYEALLSLDVDALISIGGDDTLKTANKFKMYQERLPASAKRIPVVHLPKTIDNDYLGIDFTFGYFTAVEFLAGEIRNLLHDAEASQAYFLTETMGRSAGWLSYGAAIAGEASLVVSVEDIIGSYRISETYTDESSGQSETHEVMDVDRVINRIVKTMIARDAEGKHFGVIVLAEGLAELLPMKYLKGIPRDEHDHIRPRPQGHGPATWLRIALCQAAGLRRDARQPARRRRLSCARRRRPQRRHGFRHRPATTALRPLRKAHRLPNPRHRRPLHRAQQRFPPPRAVFGDVCQ